MSGPKIASDNLRSEDSAEILIGLCEGPIAGLQDGKSSFYMNDTPLNTNGEDNFDDYELEIYNGDASTDQKINFTLGGISKQSAVTVNTELVHQNDTATCMVNTLAIDFIDVRVQVGQLYTQSKKGNVKQTSGQFSIEYRKVVGSKYGPWLSYNNGVCTISGKTTSPYTKDYRINVERDDENDGRWQVRVTRLSGDSSSDSNGYFFKLYFIQCEGVDSTEREFKNTALAHLTIKTTDQLTQLPQVYGIYKLLKIRVPSNYDPEAHTYNGLWDGTFKIAWTDNPAWCLYDLIMNDRYGVNSYFPVTPDKWDFYEAGQYCDAVGKYAFDGENGVPVSLDGKEREPRYTLNMLITESQSGPDMLNYIASTFNGVVYEDATGLVRLAIDDATKPAVQIFNPANVTPAGFSYTFTDPASRYNDFTVTFVNPDLEWNEDRRRVTTPYGEEDQEIYKRIPYNFNAVGCIKESEAVRKARYKLISTLKETMSVSFTTNRVAMNVNLFDTILIADPNMNYSQTGRIKSISEDRGTIYLRDPVFIESEGSYEVNIQTSNSVMRCGVNISEYGNVKELNLDNKLPDNVYEKAVFTLSGTADNHGNPKPFKVVGITEQSGNPDNVTITAVEIFRNKQYEADIGISLSPAESDSSTRDNYTNVPQVLDCQFKELYNEDRMQNALVLGITLDWDHYPYYTGNFRVYSREKGGDEAGWEERTVEDGDTIFDHPAGVYEFRIMPETTLGVYPDFNTAPIFEFDVSENAAPAPDKVENFEANGNVENVTLTWDAQEDASTYEIRIGDDWESGKVIGENISENKFYYTAAEKDQSYRFMIKAINNAGRYSDYASVAYGALNPPQDVQKFWITPNLDSLRFDWVAEQENYVSYEVRMGAAWESGVTLFTTMGRNQTVLNPGYDPRTRFYIKALSKKGIYSNTALYGLIKQNLKQNRNVLLKVDNAEGKLNYFTDSAKSKNITDDSSSEDKKAYTGRSGTKLTPWFGVTHGLLKSTANTQMMASNFYNAEHFFPIHIPNDKGEDTIARNWYDTEFFRYGQALTWEDLQWAWDSKEGHSTSWINHEDAYGYGGRIQLLITTKKPDKEYGGFLGLRFNSTTQDITGETKPAVESRVLFGDGKYDQALVLYKTLKLKYNLNNLESDFSFRFKVHLDANTPADNKLVTFSNPNTKARIVVYMQDGKIIAERSDGVKAEAEFSYERYLDYMSVMVTQSEDKLSLDYYLEYANVRGRTETECKPLGTYTELWFGENNE